MTTGLRAATRKSTLARTQTDLIAGLLGVEVTPVVVDTMADRDPDTPVWAMNDRGVFVKEVQEAVLDGRADLAVHSAKDLPSTTPDGLVIGAIPEREDPRDALVGRALGRLPVGALIGTGSIRRRAQLAWLRADLTFAGLRGNIETRLAKAHDFDAIVVAVAALRRLDRLASAADVLDVGQMVPQVGQGALAVECRAGDSGMHELLAGIDHAVSRSAVEAERAWLAELGGGCDSPVGAHATVDEGGTIHLTGMLASGDGRIVLRDWAYGDDPVEVGRGLARRMIERSGGAWLVDEASPAVAPVPA